MRILLIALLTALPQFGFAENDAKPILVIGASYANGKTPFNMGLSAPLLGLAVRNGSYLSLGDALIREHREDGFVINEAQGGATTFERPSCRFALYGDACGTAVFDSYTTQLQRAMARVRSVVTLELNADYVVIEVPNDCMHSDAFGIPESQTSECTEDDMQAVADRMIGVGQLALSQGLTPIYGGLAPLEGIDLELLQQSSFLLWTISPANYERLREIMHDRITADLPGALFVDYWAGYEHIGDGTHPSIKTARRAARRILSAISNARGCGSKPSHGTAPAHCR